MQCGTFSGACSIKSSVFTEYVSDYFVPDAIHAKVFVMARAAAGNDHNVLCQQPCRRPSVWRGPIRHDAPRIENPRVQIWRAKRELRQQRPIQHFFNFQNRQQKRSRPRRNTQYCELRRPSSIGPKGSSRSPVSALREGVRDENRRLIACFLLRRSCDLRTARSRSSRVKGLVTYPSSPCLLSPYFRSPCPLDGGGGGGGGGGTRNQQESVELGVALQNRGNMKSVAVGHHYVQQDHAGPFVRDGFLDPPGIVHRDRPVAFFF